MALELVDSLIGVLLSSKVKEKVQRPTAALSMTVRDQVVLGSTTANGAAFTVTLPSVAEAVGKEVLIYMVARNGAKDITVADFKDDASLGNIVLDAADEYTLLKSSGEKWFEVASNHA